MVTAHSENTRGSPGRRAACSSGATRRPVSTRSAIPVAEPEAAAGVAIAALIDAPLVVVHVPGQGPMAAIRGGQSPGRERLRRDLPALSRPRRGRGLDRPGNSKGPRRCAARRSEARRFQAPLWAGVGGLASSTSSRPITAPTNSTRRASSPHGRNVAFDRISNGLPGVETPAADPVLGGRERRGPHRRRPLRRPRGRRTPPRSTGCIQGKERSRSGRMPTSASGTRTGRSPSPTGPAAPAPSTTRPTRECGCAAGRPSRRSAGARWWPRATSFVGPPGHGRFVPGAARVAGARRPTAARCPRSTRRATSAPSCCRARARGAETALPRSHWRPTSRTRAAPARLARRGFSSASRLVADPAAGFAAGARSRRAWPCPARERRRRRARGRAVGQGPGMPAVPWRDLPLRHLRQAPAGARRAGTGTAVCDAGRAPPLRRPQAPTTPADGSLRRPGATPLQLRGWK